MADRAVATTEHLLLESVSNEVFKRVFDGSTVSALEYIDNSMANEGYEENPALVRLRETVEGMSIVPQQGKKWKLRGITRDEIALFRNNQDVYSPNESPALQKELTSVDIELGSISK